MPPLATPTRRTHKQPGDAHHPARASQSPATAPQTAYTTHSPLPHQQAALAALANTYTRRDRAQLVHACGAGKTRTAAMFAHAHRLTRILVVLPSLQLVRQTMTEWAHQYEGNIDFRAVCSDPTVEPTDERFEGQGMLLSDTTALARFLTEPTSRPRVVFATYHSTPKIAAAVRSLPQTWPGFDLIVCDEAHRLTGATDRDFTTVLHNDAIPAARRLFMTATPKTRTHHASTTGDTIAGMDDHALFGPVAHEYTFGEAIKDRRLTPYRLTILGIDPANDTPTGSRLAYDATDDDTRHLIGQVAALRAMTMFNLRRVVSFHANIARAERFASDITTLNNRRLPAAHVRDLQAAAIHSAHTATRRADALNMLNPAQPFPALVANPRLLTEGVDVPALDGVVFVDPRNSLVDTIQAVGRVLRAAPGKTIGHIIIPVLATHDANPADTLNGAGFATAWTVLDALAAMDTTLTATVNTTHANATDSDLPTAINADFTHTGIDADYLSRITRLRMVQHLADDPTTVDPNIYCRCSPDCGVILDRLPA